MNFSKELKESTEEKIEVKYLANKNKNFESRKLSESDEKIEEINKKGRSGGVENNRIERKRKC